MKVRGSRVRIADRIDVQIARVTLRQGAFIITATCRLGDLSREEIQLLNAGHVDAAIIGSDDQTVYLAHYPVGFNLPYDCPDENLTLTINARVTDGASSEWLAAHA